MFFCFLNARQPSRSSLINSRAFPDLPGAGGPCCGPCCCPRAAPAPRGAVSVCWGSVHTVAFTWNVLLQTAPLLPRGHYPGPVQRELCFLPLRCHFLFWELFCCFQYYLVLFHFLETSFWTLCCFPFWLFVQFLFPLTSLTIVLSQERSFWPSIFNFKFTPTYQKVSVLYFCVAFSQLFVSSL